MLRQALAFSLAVLMAGCSQLPPAPLAPLNERLAALGLRQGESLERLERSDIGGWRVLDEQHLILDNGPARTYLVSLSIPCHGLDDHNRLAFTYSLGALTRFDRVLATDGGLLQRCPVQAIHRLQRLSPGDA